jgi:hypothetical protein
MHTSNSPYQATRHYAAPYMPNLRLAIATGASIAINALGVDLTARVVDKRRASDGTFSDICEG